MHQPHPVPGVAPDNVARVWPVAVHPWATELPGDNTPRLDSSRHWLFRAPAADSLKVPIRIVATLHAQRAKAIPWHDPSAAVAVQSIESAAACLAGPLPRRSL